jgi:hypothetical protein
MERRIMDEWHELEEAKKKIQLDQQRERAAQAAMADDRSG